MKALITVVVITICGVLAPAVAFAQDPESDPLRDYRQFLDQHKDMSTSELLEMHPAGPYLDGVGIPWESVQYHDLIEELDPFYLVITHSHENPHGLLYVWSDEYCEPNYQIKVDGMAVYYFSECTNS